ncbi:hypothetical protein F7734_08155 [Scytonema sp. UIC 10036]|uniref:hypothetical protein n=1 Tax=Scytonema sp. UIC 10036 TaxID=2304196 RepID=UPI0012DAD865|nr:hypothetical protein [Scytonema sp. UIC 10036]MUG92430.1 hypothetical protein [Scytonema sp. UIC 10036]
MTNDKNQNVQKYTVLLACCFSLVGLFFGSIYPTICSILLNHLPKGLHGTMSGLIVIFSEAGIAVGVLTIGFITNNVSIHDAFYFMLLPIGILPFLLISYYKLSVGPI